MESPQAAVPLVPQPLSLGYQVGPVLILISLAFMLFGGFCAQVYFYWSTYDKDHYAIRTLVAAIWCMETVHTGFCMHFLYIYFVVDIGAPEKFADVPWSVAGSLFLELTVIACCQGFYLFRLWRLSGRNAFVVAIPSVFLLARLGGGFASLSFLWILKSWPAFDSHKPAQSSMNVALSLSAVVDAVITALMIFYLRKNMTGFRRSRSVVQRLISFSINTGLITIFGSVTVLIFFKFMRNSLAYGSMIEILSKLYANSVLGFLNSRQQLREQMYDQGINSIPLQLRGGTGGSGSRTEDTASYKHYASDMSSSGEGIGKRSVESRPMGKSVAI